MCLLLCDADYILVESILKFVSHTRVISGVTRFTGVVIRCFCSSISLGKSMIMVYHIYLTLDKTYRNKSQDVKSGLATGKRIKMTVMRSCWNMKSSGRLCNRGDIQFSGISRINIFDDSGFLWFFVASNSSDWNSTEKHSPSILMNFLKR